MTKSALKQLLHGDRLATAAGAHNPLTAALVEEAGFDVVWASGLEISASMGVPDANVLSVTECLSTAAAMAARVGIPVLADCDSGFGGITNVIHMVQDYEAAGIAGVCIEDKTFPKLNSFVAGPQQLVPIEDFAGKIAAAVASRRSADFVVVARIEAFIAGHGLEEALRRARAYELAGADALLVHSKLAVPDEVVAFCDHYTGDVPVVAVPTTYASTTMDELHAAGVSLAIYANQGLRSAIASTRETFAAILRHGCASAVESRLVPLSDVFGLQGTARMLEAEKRFEQVGRGVAAQVDADLAFDWAAAHAG
ncbi:isocitrate lyase/phosphoenolpyruvate mutase family protein [Cellulomonas iranensis]|uniref:Phosphoenolpyruvate phosphomutase n=1 Tax=Cellulomonas iranensis TaxID=76862 RepID=A0ABU0GJ72_9CELL|nr:isocitrate lyase/phosphoenolpyruvate mutase family protein [Cellulomonas iranensis]MDQ0424645.1 phosphoenolpyruvate phosphomutase [Cellulomonas iranensis]